MMAAGNGPEPSGIAASKYNGMPSILVYSTDLSHSVVCCAGAEPVRTTDMRRGNNKGRELCPRRSLPSFSMSSTACEFQALVNATSHRVPVPDEKRSLRRYECVPAGREDKQPWARVLLHRP